MRKGNDALRLTVGLFGFALRSTFYHTGHYFHIEYSLIGCVQEFASQRGCAFYSGPLIIEC